MLRMAKINRTTHSANMLLVLVPLLMFFGDTGLNVSSV